MSIQKKSLINTLQTAKKANVASAPTKGTTLGPDSQGSTQGSLKGVGRGHFKGAAKGHFKGAAKGHFKGAAKGSLKGMK